MFESIWNEVKIDGKPSLDSNMSTEVAVVGAGLAGILIAYYLRMNGKNVIILEADQIASGMTKNTTAKITSQHNLIYKYLIDNFGTQKAKEYATYNERAIQEYENLVKEKQIDCDFKREDAYVYTMQNAREIEAEVQSARTLDMEAELVTETALPFQVAVAEKFPNQASFHPIKFIKALADELEIYEHSQVIDRKGEHTLIVSVKKEDGTEEEHEVEADDIIFANHYPFEKLKGLYATRMYQEREDILVVKAPEALPYGMYIGADNTGYSFRKYNDYLIVAGYNHRTGLQGVKNPKEELENAVKHYYPECEVCYHMVNQDCMTLDRVPYIGHYTNHTSHIYIATGFNKWGISHSMVSALILTEMICKGDKKEESIYNPHRVEFQASKEEMKKHFATTLSHLTMQKLPMKPEDIEKIQQGEGAVISKFGRKIAVYHAEDGSYQYFSARCPHLGCILEWNSQEKSWDCPCHGSRFHADGTLINGPALENMKDRDEN